MFKFSVDNTKECIIETEQHLRDLVSTVLTENYGPTWDNTIHGWSESEREELIRRFDDERKKFPHQKLSDRLLDYSDILHLKGLIQKNWQHFSRVFSSKENTLTMFDILQKLRNPMMHGRQGLLLHQHYLCLGICGEFLLAIENWRKGYTHNIRSYACNLRFSIYEQDNEEGTTNIQAKEQAENWLELIKTTLSVTSEEKHNDNCKEWLLRLSGGHVRIYMTWNYRGYDGRYFRSADIKLETSSHKALDQILTAGKHHPYWVLCWELSGDLDVSVVASKAKEMAGKEPSSSQSVQIGSGEPKLTGADFSIDKLDSCSIRLTMSRGQSGIGAKVCLVCDGALNKGFSQAHKVFSMDNILSILYGRMTPNKIHQLIKDACAVI